MEFFNMNFSGLFKEKHGNQLFNDISNIIQKESSNIDNNYIELVFKIAFFDFFGIDNCTSEKIIKDTMLMPNIDVKKLKITHKNSIKEIQKYLKSATNIKK